MRAAPGCISWLAVAAAMFWATGSATAQARVPRTAPAVEVPLSEIPESHRDQVRQVIEQPTVSYRGGAEEFPSRPALYHWLLDHPDRASQAWRRLGAPCLEIADRGAGKFGYADAQGCDVGWQTVYSTPEMRIWYAEGKARPMPLLPAFPGKAVVVLHHQHWTDSAGRQRVRHQADLFLQTDSKTASLLLRLIGPSVPRLSEQCLSQMELFFSGLARYLDCHPDQTEDLLFGTRPLGWLIDPDPLHKYHPSKLPWLAECP